MIEGDSALHDVAQSPLVGVLARGPLVDLDAGFRRENLESLREGQPVALHDEAEDVAALAAPEALPGIAGRGNRERRSLLAVEGAETLVRRASLLQLDRLANDVDDAELVLDLGSNADRQTDLPTRASARASGAPDLRAPRVLVRLDHPDTVRGLSSLDKPDVRSLALPCQDSLGVLTRDFLRARVGHEREDLVVESATVLLGARTKQAGPPKARAVDDSPRHQVVGLRERAQSGRDQVAECPLQIRRTARLAKRSVQLDGLRRDALVWAADNLRPRDSRARSR